MAIAAGAVALAVTLVVVDDPPDQTAPTGRPLAEGPPGPAEDAAPDDSAPSGALAPSTGVGAAALRSGGGSEATQRATAGNDSPSSGSGAGANTTTPPGDVFLRDRPLRAHEDAGVVSFRYDTTCGAMADGGGAGVGDYVEYRTEDGTARAGIDYTPTSGRLQHDGGVVRLQLLSDAAVEGDETVRFIFTYKGVGTCEHPFEVEQVLTITDGDR